jgi:hypothetical protein
VPTMNTELSDALAKARSAVAHLVSLLAKGDDQGAYREAKVAEKELYWVATRLAPPRGSHQAGN